MTELEHVKGPMAAIEEADSARVTIIQRVVKKNCILMINYGVATVGGIVDSYLIDNTCLSAALSIAVAVGTFFIGKHMMKEVLLGEAPEPCPFCKWLSAILSAIWMWLSGTLSAIWIWLNP
jgi:hypothetical protein